jgi:hypothetical protein
MPTTFIPPNYPKSFIVFVIAVLTGLVSGGILILRAWLESALLETIGRLAFFACSAVAAAMFAVFLPGSWTGKYRDLPSRPWKEQVW